MNKKDEFKLENQKTTVWSFPQRGQWLTHNSKYRGNWAPQIVANIIELYSNEGEVVLDPMVGGGTTMIEAKARRRIGIGFDIHSEVVEIAQKACSFSGDKYFEPVISQADARNLQSISDNSVDLVATHPPYLNIIKYGISKNPDDLSSISSVKKFCDELEKIDGELFRVLKPGKYCAILIGDTRRRRHYVPLAYQVMMRFLRPGFILKEDIIKIQHNCSATKYWDSKQKDFLLIMHEHLFIFRKPRVEENVQIFKDNSYAISENLFDENDNSTDN